MVIPPANNSSEATGAIELSKVIKTVIDQYKLKTQEIAATALLDNTQNGVLRALPLCKKTPLQHEDIQHNARQGRFKKKFFRDTCTSGIRVLGKEVSFLWNLVLTFFGPFAVVVVNLIFKHIHVETPLPWSND